MCKYLADDDCEICIRHTFPLSVPLWQEYSSYISKKRREIVTFSSTTTNVTMKTHREKEEFLDFESRYITVLPTDLLQSYFLPKSLYASNSYQIF